MMTRTHAKIGAALAMILFTLSGCGQEGDKAAEKKPAAANARAVNTARIESRVIEGGLSASGVLVSREEAAVSAEVTGFRVARVLADMGDYVRAGQPLVELDDALLRSQIDQSTALVAQADVQARQATAQAARVTGLEGTGALAQEQIEQRRFAAESAKAAAAAQAAQLADLKTRASKMIIRAPVSGLILERTVRPGDMSGASGQPMFRMARDGLVELEANAPEAALAAVRTGSPASVLLPDGRRVSGTVRLVGPAVDSATSLGKVRVSLPGKLGLRPGGFGQAQFLGGSTSALTAPEGALLYDANGVSVMALDSGNRVHQTRVKTGRRGGGYVELIEGPAAGTRVLVGAASFVLEGDVVKPVERPAEK